MEQPEWRIYYADDTTFDSSDGSWADAPSRGVMAVAVRSEEVGREIEWGKDYYLWWPGADQPWGVDRAGLWDFLRELQSPLADVALDNEHFAELEKLEVKFGRSVSTSDFKAMMNWVIEDPGFPAKSAVTRRESSLAPALPRLGG